MAAAMAKNFNVNCASFVPSGSKIVLCPEDPPRTSAHEELKSKASSQSKSESDLVDKKLKDSFPGDVKPMKQILSLLKDKAGKMTRGLIDLVVELELCAEASNVNSDILDREAHVTTLKE